jgi:hypothetical protein
MIRTYHRKQPEHLPGRGERRSSHWLLRFLSHLKNDIRAQDQIEYAVCVGTISLVAAMAIPAIAESISTVLLNTEAVLIGAPVNPGAAAPAGSNGNCGNPNPGSFKGRSPCAP